MMFPRTPRFVTRTMATTFATVVFILGAVLLVVTLIVRDRVRPTVIDHLTTQQGVLRTLEQRRLAEMQAQAETLAVVAPTLRLDDERIEPAFVQGPRSTLVNFPRT
jgi:hypothetical protein